MLLGFFEKIDHVLVIQEAEVMFNFGLAGKYYPERIVRYKNDPECWFDYGVFNLRLNDVQKAEECFKRVVSINQLHMQGILLTGQLRTRRFLRLILILDLQNFCFIIKDNIMGSVGLSKSFWNRGET